MAQRHQAGTGKGGQFAARKAAQMPPVGPGHPTSPGVQVEQIDEEAILATRGRIKRLNRQAGALGGAGALACVPMVLAIPGVWDGISEGWQALILSTCGAVALVSFWGAAASRHIAACDLQKGMDAAARGMRAPMGEGLGESMVLGWVQEDRLLGGVADDDTQPNGQPLSDLTEAPDLPQPAPQAPMPEEALPSGASSA